METSRSRASKRLCVTAFVVGDMVTDVCSHILGDITVKYSCESRFVDFDERHHSTGEWNREDKIFRLHFFPLWRKIIFHFVPSSKTKRRRIKTKIKKIFYNLYNIWYIIKIFCQTYYTPFYCDIYYLFYRITHSIKSFILSLIINLYL